MNDSASAEPLSDRILLRLKNNRFIAILIVASVAVMGFASTLESVQKITALVIASERDGAVPVVLPKNTGWVFLGYFSKDLNAYTKGPLYTVVKSAYPDKTLQPRVNDWIKLTEQRRVIIADFATKGLTLQYDPPWKKNVLTDDDDTGLKLSKGSVVEVRDISLGAYSGRDSAVWARVGATE